MTDERPSNLLPVNPFSAYDVLGYLIPGMALLMGVVGYEYWAVNHLQVASGVLHTPVYTAFRAVLPIAPDLSWAAQTASVLAILAGSYIVGHLVASASAVAIERIYIGKGHGYPYRAILGLADPVDANPMTKPFYKALYFWLNVYLLCRYWTLGDRLGFDSIQFPLFSIEVATFRVIASWLGWGLVALVAIKLIGSTRLARGPNRLKDMLETKRGVAIARCLDLIVAYAAKPGHSITHLFANRLPSRTALDPYSQDQFEDSFYKLFLRRPPSDVGSTTFWFALLYLRDKARHLAGPADNWLRLYSFARNLAGAFFLAFLYCFLWWRAQPSVTIRTSEAAQVFLVAPIMLWLAGCAMLVRYHYLYADYFTKYVLRTFVYLSTPAHQLTNSDVTTRQA